MATQTDDGTAVQGGAALPVYVKNLQMLADTLAGLAVAISGPLAVYGPDEAGSSPTRAPVLIGGHNQLDDLVVRLRAADTGELMVFAQPTAAYRPASATTGATPLTSGADASVVDSNPNRYRITLVNPDTTNTIILAVGAGASTATGYYLLPLTAVTFETTAAIVAKSTAGTPTLRWVEEY